jgi:hypothetical protein
VPFELFVDVGRELVFDEVGKQADQVVAAFHALFRFNLQPSTFNLQKSYPIHIENRGFRNHSLPVVPSRNPW